MGVLLQTAREKSGPKRRGGRCAVVVISEALAEKDPELGSDFDTAVDAPDINARALCEALFEIGLPLDDRYTVVRVEGAIRRHRRSHCACATREGVQS